MKKKLLWLLLFVCVVIFPLTAKETKAETEGDWEYFCYGLDATIDAYNGTDENVVVPEKLGGKDVVAIGYNAFSGNEIVKTVKLPSSVTYIGSSAFSGCISLETIEIPETVESMEISSFTGTKWLENNLVDGKYLIVNNILYDAQNLNDDVVIPEGVKKIKTSEFYTTSIHSISFPASVEEIIFDSPWQYPPENLYEISVDADNKNYSSYDGCLYSKDKKTLYWCPRLKESVSVYPETTQIADHAFSIVIS